jgi:hypothetical protein
LKSNHILISISKEYFYRILKEEKQTAPLTSSTEPANNLSLEAPEEDNETKPEPEDEMHLTLPTNLKENANAISVTVSKKDTLFVSSSTTDVKTVEPLPEETKEEAAELKSKYKDSTRNKWIEKFMKNNEYGIVDNEGGGDCFFAVIRDAFESIGKQTTVEKLRALLAEEATPRLFEETRSLYLNFVGELQEKEKEIKEIKKTSTLLKKNAEKAPTQADNDAVLKQAKELNEQYKQVVLEKQDTQELLKEFKHMENLDTLEKFKSFIKTSQYWADTWAVSTLEKLLNIKVVIFSQESFQSGDIDSVLQCGQLNDSDLEKTGSFRPDYYILTSYTGSHYTLITYKNQKLFKIREVPYDIKVLVLNKCMERNAGPYYLIDDFRTMKSKLGLEANLGEPTEEDEEKETEWLQQDLYEKDIVFMFHDRSDGEPKAGKGSGEKIPPSRLIEFHALNKIKDKNWRKQLDDAWISPFSIDGKRWGSVEHYFLASQYKKGFPDFFAQFSLDSKSDMSKDIAMAKAATSKSGKYKDMVLRDRKVVADADFFEIKVEPRYMQERKLALYAKFSQNLDLKRVLLETHRAKLIHFVRSREPEVDVQLMQLRKELMVHENIGENI